MNKYMIEKFSYENVTNVFSIEASELKNGPSPTITIVSHSGNEVMFARVGVERTDDEDNEITAWTYKPAAESVERNPRLKDCALIVFND